MIPTTGRIMLIDTSKCIACKACQVACKQWNGLPTEGWIQDDLSGDWHTEFTGTYKNAPDMSAVNLTVVKFSEADDASDQSDPINADVSWLFFPDRCRHCEKPFCKGACPLGAIEQSRSGMVYITDACDPYACSGASVDFPRPCQQACPYNVPKWKYMKDGSEWAGDPGVAARMQKCTFCIDRWTDPQLRGDGDPPSPQDGGRFRGRFAKSNIPACELACPTGAIQTGVARRMKRRAIRRTRLLRSSGRYPRARIYSGLPESCGTHVIWILTDRKDKYQDGTIEWGTLFPGP